jgi:nitroreductase
MPRRLDSMIQRTSCRVFAPGPMPEAILDRVLATAIHAPSGGNLQPVSIIKVLDKERRATLAEWCGQPFMSAASVHLIFCLDFHRLERWAALSDAPFTMPKSFRHFWIGFQDVIIAAQQISAACDQLEIGNVYIGTIIEYIPEVRTLFNLPMGVLPVTLLILGPKGESPKPRLKLPLQTLIHTEIYHDPSDHELLKAFAQKYPEPLAQATPQLMKALLETSRAVGGEDFAKRVQKRVQHDGGLNRAQSRFGSHYRADMMPEGNSKFLKDIQEAGFDIITKIRA